MAETQQQAPGGAPQFQLKHRLGLAMEIADIEREDIAAELGVHKNTVANYLRGDTRPSRSVLRVWALRCGVPFEWLETGRSDVEYGPDTDTRMARCIRGPWIAQATGALSDADEQVA
jgi:transcriptional regulator with XRE-family HTH domain